MSEPVKKIKISQIECRGLRSADFLSKNDVYVVFKVGTKKAKTKYVSNAGKNVKFKEVIEMYVNDQDLMAGIDFTAYDYDVGPDPDDLLGVGKLSNLIELKKFPDQQRQFDTHLMYKGKNRGEATCIVELSYPAGGAMTSQQIGNVGGQVFNAAMQQQAAPIAQTAAPVGSVVQPDEPATMRVTCPANAHAGMQVVVQAPDGQRLQVIIPQGVQPGMAFRVPLPKPAVAQPTAQAYAPPAYQQPVATQAPPQYAAPPPQYAQHPPPQYAQPPPQYAQPPPQYAQQPPPQYAQQPPPYGYPPQQPYGAPPPPAYGQPPPHYGYPPRPY